MLFVHGYEGLACPGDDGEATFGPTIAFLRARGWDQAMVTDGYYDCDRGMVDTLAGYGAPAPLGKGLAGRLPGGRETDIRDVAYHLAWQIYRRYSSRGVAVDVVAHSMGGLIVRWMLYRVQAGDAGFPRRLLVHDAVAIATPNGGAPFAAFCGNVECREMAPGSDFLRELAAAAPDPQGTGGTDWTLIASDADPIVGAASATSMPGVHRVVYAWPAYTHAAYLGDTITTTDADVTIAGPNGGHATRWEQAPHALAMVDQALASPDW